MRMFAGVMLAVLALAVGVLWLGNGGDPAPVLPDEAPGLTQGELDALTPRIAAFCGNCHATPAPDTFPRDAWFAEVEQGYRFYEESGRSDLDPPLRQQVVAYYRALAPESLVIPDTVSTPEGSRSFTPQTAALAEDRSFPAVAHLIRDPQDSSRVLLCDMRGGEIAAVDFENRSLAVTVLAKLDNPAHVEFCDLNADGTRDLVVADLGSFLPADHSDGRVVWLEGTADGYIERTLLEDVSRVADVRPGDFDGDGDLDLVVAEFGWRKTGCILFLEQTGVAEGIPEFESRVLDPRHGTIHVPLADLNDDGALDFVALVSQEYEAVDVFINDGRATFEPTQLYGAGDPSYGSSGIELVDLDGDGDVDILYTNGDSLDSHYLKPYHAIHWLENEGGLQFRHRELARLAGASRALAADFDGDGDLDVVCCSYLPITLRRQRPLDSNETLILLEQTSPGEFARRTLQTSERGYIAMEAGDFDGDGDVDVITGNFGEQSVSDPDWLTVWWNDGPSL